jgi:hypothetical protein
LRGLEGLRATFSARHGISHYRRHQRIADDEWHPERMGQALQADEPETTNPAYQETWNDAS